MKLSTQNDWLRFAALTLTAFGGLFSLTELDQVFLRTIELTQADRLGYPLWVAGELSLSIGLMLAGILMGLVWHDRQRLAPALAWDRSAELSAIAAHNPTIVQELGRHLDRAREFIGISTMVGEPVDPDHKREVEQWQQIHGQMVEIQPARYEQFDKDQKGVDIIVLVVGLPLLVGLLLALNASTLVYQALGSLGQAIVELVGGFIASNDFLFVLFWIMADNLWAWAVIVALILAAAACRLCRPRRCWGDADNDRPQYEDVDR